jgi:hypothetical protein
VSCSACAFSLDSSSSLSPTVDLVKFKNALQQKHGKLFTERPCEGTPDGETARAVRGTRKRKLPGDVIAIDPLSEAKATVAPGQAIKWRDVELYTMDARGAMAGSNGGQSSKRQKIDEGTSTSSSSSSSSYAVGGAVDAAGRGGMSYPQVEQLSMATCAQCGAMVVSSKLDFHVAHCIQVQQAEQSRRGTGTVERRASLKRSASMKNKKAASEAALLAGYPPTVNSITAPFVPPNGKRKSGTRPLNVDLMCGVLVNSAVPCRRSLTCKQHSANAKRKVPGRSKRFDDLLNDFVNSKGVYAVNYTLPSPKFAAVRPGNAGKDALADDMHFDIMDVNAKMGLSNSSSINTPSSSSHSTASVRIVPQSTNAYSHSKINTNNTAVYDGSFYSRSWSSELSNKRQALCSMFAVPAAPAYAQLPPAAVMDASNSQVCVCVCVTVSV